MSSDTIEKRLAALQVTDGQDVGGFIASAVAVQAFTAGPAKQHQVLSGALGLKSFTPGM